MSGLNKDDIIRMAKEVGGYITKQYPDELRIDTDDLASFANLVAAAEREACAKFILSVDLSGIKNDPALQHYTANLLIENAKAIRARGQK
jgi:hypothetical protein